MRYRVVEHGRIMATRERGAEVRRAIGAVLSSMPPDDVLVLDFSGVEIVSFSIGDEVVARVLGDMADGGFDQRPILVSDANGDVLDPILRALQRREVFGARLDGDRILLLNAPDHLQATFDAARERGEFRASELAADLGIGLPACNIRLKPLLAAGLLARAPGIARSGGREFVYHVPPGLRSEHVGAA